MKALHEVVVRHPRVRGGAPVFAGTRVAVRTLLEHLDRGGNLGEFVARHPQVTIEQAAAACALGLEALLSSVPLESAEEQASLLPRTTAAGVIINPEELGARQVVGRKVRCPACRSLVFKAWPEGWDSHAARRCRGLKSKDEAARKAEFKRRYDSLFLS